MLSKIGEIRRIAFVINRVSQISRELFRGTMLYTRHNARWVVRVFEVSTWREPWLDMKGVPPDGIILHGVPVRAAQRALERLTGSSAAAKRIPIMAVGQDAYPGVGTLSWDTDGVAEAAVGLFQRRGCQHIAYVGASDTSYLRASRKVAKSVEAQARLKGFGFSAYRRRFSKKGGLWLQSGGDFLEWVDELPKPCGIFAWDDRIGRNVSDLCRLNGINIPGSVYLLCVGDDDLICENTSPTLSSISLDVERCAFLAAKALDDMIDRKFAIPPHLACGVRALTERASTQDSRGSGRLVALACEFIAKNACREGGLNQSEIAAHLGVSTRTLQMRFKEAAFARTILQEVHRVQLERVCRLLTSGDMPISEITYSSGFGSLSRLKALFQKTYGMSMRDYRKLKKTAPPPEIMKETRIF